MIPQYQLRPRELEAVGHLADGHTYAEVGRAMFLSERTVKGHVQHARCEMGARNTLHLIALVMRTGQLT